MTQRVDLATVMDRLAIDEVVTGYAVALDDNDWGAFRGLFTPDGRADYTGAGGIEGPVTEISDWLSKTLGRFSVRQHLIVNRRLRIHDLDGYSGDQAELEADYHTTVRREPSEDLVCGGRFAFSLLRGDAGWRLRTVIVDEMWRRTAG